MMKTILLLAFVVFASGSHVKDKKILLRELVHNLADALKNLTMEHKGKDVFLEDLTTDPICSEYVFCKAERELKKVSGLTKYDDFRTDKTLMRDLHMYNVHNGTICNDKPDDDGPVQIILRDFLNKLLKCVKNAYAKK